jgi:L-rhamnose-H+ transport protein
MQPNPFLGVFLHSIGGLAAASFYVPYRRVRGWAWETFWLTGGLFSWIVAPWVVSLIAAPDTVAILRESPRSSVVWAYLFGLLWGVGGLTFGLSMRYLGIALGYAVALGFCAGLGTLVPPLFHGELGGYFLHHSGRVTLFGVAVSLVGIAISGMAGRSKERELSEEAKQATIREFSFVKGIVVAIFAGVMSACMAFAIDAAGPIGKIAVAHHVPDLFQTSPAFIVIMAGGFTTNFVWCVLLSIRNRTAGDYVDAKKPLALNYLLCIVAGVTWYLQFMFYGMGSTQMGDYKFSSWALHMSAIIIFSTLWGIALKEWRGTGARTRALVAAGLVVLIGSMLIVGYGNNLEAARKAAEAAVQTR